MVDPLLAAQSPVRQDDAVLVDPGLSTVENRCDMFQRGRPLGLRDQLDESPADQLLSPPSEEAAVRLVHERERRVRQIPADKIALILDDAAIPLLALAQGVHDQATIGGDLEHLRDVFEERLTRLLLVCRPVILEVCDVDGTGAPVGQGELRAIQRREILETGRRDLECSEPGAHGDRVSRGPRAFDGPGDIFQTVARGHEIVALQDASTRRERGSVLALASQDLRRGACCLRPWLEW